MGWVTFWAIFFTNSSGHPDANTWKIKSFKNVISFYIREKKTRNTHFCIIATVWQFTLHRYCKLNLRTMHTYFTGTTDDCRPTKCRATIVRCTGKMLQRQIVVRQHVARLNVARQNGKRRHFIGQYFIGRHFIGRHFVARQFAVVPFYHV
jgi:hypothetical protein